MLIKSGPRGARLGPQWSLSALFAILASLESQHDGFFTITSGREGKHQAGSLHYVDLAVDMTYTPKSQQQQFVAILKKNLGDDFDVVDERTHLHVEFQPKKAL